MSLCYSIVTSLTHLNSSTKTTDLLRGFPDPKHFVVAIDDIVHRGSVILPSLMLPDNFIDELLRAGLISFSRDGSMLAQLQAAGFL